jgi:DNA-binding transcriptional MerR regulator
MTVASDSWRIDELAQRSGASVDTIRFYQRDGLLPPARKEGRSLLFGPAHLRRLEQIRDLQARHFNLAAVKALLSDSQLLAVQAMFSDNEPTLSRDQLIATAALPAEMVRRIEGVGLLADPAASGRTGYDQADVDLLVAVGRLLELGLPGDVVVFLAGLYAEHFATMQARVAALFAGEGEVTWADTDRTTFIDGLGERVGEVFELTARLLNYAHQATVRRMTLAAPVSDDPPT